MGPRQAHEAMTLWQHSAAWSSISFRPGNSRPQAGAFTDPDSQFPATIFNPAHPDHTESWRHIIHFETYIPENKSFLT
jgi:hypothetical protein